MMCPFFQSLMKDLDKCDFTDKVIGGDFNLVMDVEYDRKGSDYNHHAAASYLNECLETAEMTDIWRAKNLGEERIHLVLFEANTALHALRFLFN